MHAPGCSGDKIMIKNIFFFSLSNLLLAIRPGFARVQADTKVFLNYIIHDI
jgi:hypothetical protein